MQNETTQPEPVAAVGKSAVQRFVMHDTEVCPECGMNHAADVAKKECTQERIRHLRLALRIATGWDSDKYKECLEAAEDQMTAIEGA